LLLSDENIYSSKAAFITHIMHTQHAKGEPPAPRYIYSPAKKPLFGKPHEQSSYSVCTVCALDADRQLYFARFCLGRMFVYSLDGDASFCHESEALTEVSGSGK
jgi:hypothetical protein